MQVTFDNVNEISGAEIIQCMSYFFLYLMIKICLKNQELSIRRNPREITIFFISYAEVLQTELVTKSSLQHDFH